MVLYVPEDIKDVYATISMKHGETESWKIGKKAIEKVSVIVTIVVILLVVLVFLGIVIWKCDGMPKKILVYCKGEASKKAPDTIMQI